MITFSKILFVAGSLMVKPVASPIEMCTCTTSTVEQMCFISKEEKIVKGDFAWKTRKEYFVVKIMNTGKQHKRPAKGDVELVCGDFE